MKKKATNITWHTGEVTQEDREKILNQQGVILWFTGLSGSGKSTIAVGLEKRLTQDRYVSYRLDGDNIRHGLNKDLGFSAEDREENIRRIGEVAKLFTDAGIIVMVSFISPYRKDRDAIRSLVPQGKFVEIYVKCSVESCEKRDTKGLYKKARAGEIADFTGVSAPYEEPKNPEIVVDTEHVVLVDELDSVVDVVVEELRSHGILTR